MEDKIKTYNGWFDLYDNKPNYEEKVTVILERDGCGGCDYRFSICESTYKHGYTDYFLDENDYWRVKYWRRKEIYPYPDRIVQKQIEDCKKYKVNPSSIINHQKMCGIDVEGY